MKIKEVITNLSPINKILLSFIILISIGTLLLKLPFATKNGISLINAIFTSTSAVCVTGLIVLDTAKDFTFFGQLVILTLIQFGGLGIMTFSVAVLTIFSNNLSLKWQFTLQSFYSDLNKIPIKSVIKRILFYTVLIEAIVSILLFTQFSKDYSFLRAAWYSIFHAISAFCNAGFSTFSDSLISYQSNTTFIMIISFTIILGGIGFIVLTEIIRSFKKAQNIKNKFFNYSLHTKITLIASFSLIIFGTLIFLALEWNNSLSDLPYSVKITTSFFQSVTCRTAGFNSIDLSILKENTLFSMIFLMLIGGSPGSIAGGIKTTTLLVIILMVYSKLRGRDQVVLWGRALRKETTDKSTTLLIFAIFFICISTFLILTFDTFQVKAPFIASFFEMTSAFATVGLSTGITSSLTLSGKIITCIVMFIGRLGPLTLLAALNHNKKSSNIKYPEENIMIG